MRVLVVDDDADFCLLAKRALEARGHDVDVASSAFGLVNRVAGATEAAPPDAVILDCDLPGLSGFSALELLARDRRTARVPILVASAGDTPQHRSMVLGHPFASFHQKDGHMKQLVSRLEEHVSFVISARAAPPR
jgi:two-component system, cell cycle response regulator DivK